jgi:hypothetical protein
MAMDVFNPESRAAAKHASREVDRRSIAEGRISHRSLHFSNDAFARIPFERFAITAIGNRKIDHSGSRDVPVVHRVHKGNEQGQDAHLHHADILHILGAVSDFSPIIVGGQSIGLLAEFQAVRNPDLLALAPFSSKDIDFHHNSKAARRLADVLENGRLFLPEASDMASTNAALVCGNIAGRPVIIDFMANVLGVRTEDITDRHLTLSGDIDGISINLHVMNPIDCLKSRIANINVLKRNDEQSLRQARAAIEVVKHHLDWLASSGMIDDVQSALHEIQFFIRDRHAGKPTHITFGDLIDPMQIMSAFPEDERLDERWRRMTLSPAITRIARKLAACDAARRRSAWIASKDPIQGFPRGFQG